MSFILDALKKSDAKRRAGQAPELSAAWGSPIHERRAKPWRRWLAGVGIIGCLAIGAWFVFQASSRSGVDVEPKAGVTDRASTNQNNAPNPRGREAMSLAQQIQASRKASPDQQAATEPMTAEVDAPDVSTPMEAPVSQNVVTPSQIDRARASALATLPMPDEAIADESIESVAAETSPADKDEWTPDVSDFLYIWELPLAVRQNLPPLTLNVLVFAPQPEDRFVLINGRRMQEGQSFHDGRLRLAEIRAEGALIDHQDYRFLLTQ